MTSDSADRNRPSSLVATLRDFVLRAKSSLDEEIRSYPTPIPRCDAQFNHAYEQRTRLSALLQRIDRAAIADASEAELFGALADFSTLPPLDESTEEHALRARVAATLARAGIQVVARTEHTALDVAAGDH